VLAATRGRPDAVGDALARAEAAYAEAGSRLPPEYEAFVQLVQNLSPRTLADEGAVAERLDLGRASHRTGGERAVPLAVWRSEPFQRWYATRRTAGCRLLDARVEWYERAAAPDTDPAWLLTVTIAPGDWSTPSVCRLLSAQGQGMLM
jgi:hypothetical protein